MKKYSFVLLFVVVSWSLDLLAQETGSQQKVEQAVTNTQTAADSLQAEIATLNTAISELSEKKGSLKTSVEDLQSQATLLGAKTQELQTAIEALKKEKDKREVEVVKIQDEQKKLQGDFDALKTKWQSITDKKKVSDYLKEKTFVVLTCGDQVLDYSKTTGRTGEFRSPCDLQLSYVGSPSAYYKPSRFTITQQNSTMTVYERSLASDDGGILIYPADWYNSEKIVTGKRYEMWVEYKGNSGVSDVSYKLLSFTMTKKPFVFQVAPKLYTAWRHGKDSDVTMLLPGVGVGGAYRLGDRSDDRNIIGLRGVFAFGPNLTSDNKRLQLVAGAEVVLSRYLSAGVAWVVYGPDKEGIPMILLSYGDLYPAVVNTK